MEDIHSERSKVGVFDSGVGGLSVWRELLKELPNCNYEYLSDNAYCPYGPREQGEIVERVYKAVDFLITKGVSIIVIACNTATASAIDVLRKNYKIPFIGMEPAVKPAAIHSKTGVIGVLATKATLQGRLYNNTLENYASDTLVLEKVGAGLVEAVESDRTDSPQTRELLRSYIEPMLDAGADHIVLGCTHYPFLTEEIRKITGDKVTIIDPAPAVAKHTFLVMLERGLMADTISTGDSFTNFYSTGETKTLKKLARSIIPDVKESAFNRILI